MSSKSAYLWSGSHRPTALTARHGLGLINIHMAHKYPEEENICRKAGRDVWHICSVRLTMMSLLALLSILFVCSFVPKAALCKTPDTLMDYTQLIEMLSQLGSLVSSSPLFSVACFQPSSVPLYCGLGTISLSAPCGDICCCLHGPLAKGQHSPPSHGHLLSSRNLSGQPQPLCVQPYRSSGM